MEIGSILPGQPLTYKSLCTIIGYVLLTVWFAIVIFFAEVSISGAILWLSGRML